MKIFGPNAAAAAAAAAVSLCLWLSFLATPCAAFPVAALTTEFERWLGLHRRQYATLGERAQRFETFVRNALYVQLHNAQRQKTYSLELNQFADLTFAEFQAQFVKGVRSTPSSPLSAPVDTSLLFARTKLPSRVDWRDTGCVAPVKNQGRCGSCYAFSAIGAIESAYCLKHKKELVQFSEEQVISCADAYSCNGCDGGLMTGVFEWANKTGGVCSEAEVPYLTKAEPTCPANCTKIARLSGYKSVPRYNQEALKQAVATVGPISIAIEADQIAFQFYRSGVLTAFCGDRLDHGVLLVGYGKDAETGLDYWLVKNSWGESWGEQGYIRLGMDSLQISGTCGILGMPSYPVVV